MGSEEYRERKFHVYAKRNPLNKGYNFDWEIIEFKDKVVWTYFFIENDFFFVSDKKKKITKYQDLIKWDNADYWEFVRRSTLFDEIIYPLDSLYASYQHEFYSKDKSNAHHSIHIQIDEQHDRRLYLDSKRLFPDSLVVIARDDELSTEEIFATKISNLKNNTSLPDSVLNPQFYIDKGYHLTVRQEEKINEKEKDKPGKLTEKQINLLLRLL